MNNFGKITAVIAVAGALALSGCGASAQAEPETTSTEVATEAAYEAVAVIPDWTVSNPMEQDIDLLVGSTLLPAEIHQAYTEPEIVAGAAFGLNWIEQMVNTPELYSTDRDPSVDDKVILSEFIEALTPRYQAETIAAMAVGGGHRFIPVGDADGHWTNVVTNEAGERVLDPTTWKFDGAPESVEWTNFNIEARIGQNGEILIAPTVTANYPVVSDEGEKGVIPVDFRVATLASPTEPGKWMVNGWNWTTQEMIVK